MNNTGKKRKEEFEALGLALGLCFGVALGTLLDNLALFIGLGLCIGMAFDEYCKRKLLEKDDE